MFELFSFFGEKIERVKDFPNYLNFNNDDNFELYSFGENNCSIVFKSETIDSSVSYTDSINSIIKLSKEMGISTCLCLGTFEQPPGNELAAVIAMDHINLTGWNPLIGENDESVGPRFPDMSKIYYKKIREQLKKFFTKTIGSTPSEKVLVAIEVPSYLNNAETEGLLEVDNYLYTKKFIFEAIAATHARLKVGTVLLNCRLKLNNDSEKKIVQYFASLTDN